MTPGTEIELFNPSTSGQYRIIYGDVPEVVATTYKLPNKYLPFNYIMGDTITPNELDEYNSSTQYKKGGVLKGQDGLSPWSIAVNIGEYLGKKIPVLNGQNTPVTTTKTNQTYTPSFSLSDGMIAGNINVSQIAQDAARKNSVLKNATTPATPATPATTATTTATTATTPAANGDNGTGGEVIGQLSGRVDSDINEYLRKAEQSRNRNRLTQLFAADLQRRMGNQFADKTRNNLLMNRMVSPNLS